MWWRHGEVFANGPIRLYGLLASGCTFHMFSTGTASISAEASFCSSDIAILRSIAKTLERSRHEQHCSREHNNQRNVMGAASDQSGGGMRRNSMVTTYRPRGQKSSSGCPSSSRPVLLGCPLLTCQDPSSVFCCLCDWRMTVEWLVFRSLVACYWSCLRLDHTFRNTMASSDGCIDPSAVANSYRSWFLSTAAHHDSCTLVKRLKKLASRLVGTWMRSSIPLTFGANPWCELFLHVG